MLQDYASGSRPLIDAALARNGIQANIVQEIGHPATLFPMVAAGIGISILPALALPLPEGSPLVVKRITPVVERQLMLVRRKNRSLSTAAQALWDVVRGQGRALMAGREGIRCIRYRVIHTAGSPGSNQSEIKFDGVDYCILVKIFAQFVIRITILNPCGDV